MTNPALAHRDVGYQLLQGRGIEVGPLHQPAVLPSVCQVEYCDVQSKAELSRVFPKLPLESITDVDHIIDLDTQGLAIFSDQQYDFVIFNHVIEHIANPINIIQELFRVIKNDGKVVISAPDKNFTYDRNRALTSFEHLQQEYEQGVTFVTDEHYLDFLNGVYPEIMAHASDEEIQQHIKTQRNRHEHAHVWTSESFQHFLERTFTLLSINAVRLYCHHTNKMEYFSVWQKTSNRS